MSSVSRAIPSGAGRLLCASQRNDCNRDANRISTTRMSCANASSILRSASTWARRASASFLRVIPASVGLTKPAIAPMRSSCRTSCTSLTTSGPNAGSSAFSLSIANVGNRNSAAACSDGVSTRNPSRMAIVPRACDSSDSPVSVTLSPALAARYSIALATCSAAGVANLPAPSAGRSVLFSMMRPAVTRRA